MTCCGLIRTTGVGGVSAQGVQATLSVRIFQSNLTIAIASLLSAEHISWSWKGSIGAMSATSLLSSVHQTIAIAVVTRPPSWNWMTISSILCKLLLTPSFIHF